MAPPRKYRWDEIATAYIEGTVDDQGERTWPSYRDLAERYGVRNADLINRRGSREKWVERRGAFQARIEQERRAKVAKQLADQAVEVDTRALGAARRGLAVIESRVHQLAEQQARSVAQQGAAPVDPRELSALALAGVRWHTLAMRAVGQEQERSGGTSGLGDDVAAVLAREHERQLAERVEAYVKGLRDGMASHADDELPPPVVDVEARELLATLEVVHSNGHTNGSSTNGHV